ncbi:MAG TPA: hypothetical protein VF331_12530 [Polyangiales bacterium]
MRFTIFLACAALAVPATSALAQAASPPTAAVAEPSAPPPTAAPAEPSQPAAAPGPAASAAPALAPQPPSAQPTDKPAATTTAQDSSRISLGVGVGFGDASASSGFVVTGLGSSPSMMLPGSSPFGVALIEATVTRRLRLGLSVTGAYQKLEHSDQRPVGQTNNYFPGEQSQLGAALSARWVLNPGGVVEISPLAVLGVHRGWATGLQSTYVPTTTGSGPGTYLTADATGAGIDVTAGLVLEYRLLQQLYLRFESSLARARHSHVDSVTHAGSQRLHERLNQTNLSFGWQPVLQLRFAC